MKRVCLHIDTKKLPPRKGGQPEPQYLGSNERALQIEGSFDLRVPPEEKAGVVMDERT